jgi:hypothetical protein
MMLRLVCPALMLAMALAGAVTLTLAAEDKTPARGRPYQQVSTMKIQMELEGKSITATLDDNATARDFVSLLPLTLTLRDYEATEKISDLPKKLSTESAPAGSDPSVGDLTYYSPWGKFGHIL